jgi:carbon-nitrogen hydrolase
VAFHGYDHGHADLQRPPLPEAFRVLALQGAEIVALGFNTPTENLHYPEPPALRVHHHLITAQSMAYQNATWLVETAKCGAEDNFRMFGHSLIVAPTGEIAAGLNFLSFFDSAFRDDLAPRIRGVGYVHAEGSDHHGGSAWHRPRLRSHSCSCGL